MTAKRFSFRLCHWALKPTDATFNWVYITLWKSISARKSKMSYKILMDEHRIHWNNSEELWICEVRETFLIIIRKDLQLVFSLWWMLFCGYSIRVRRFKIRETFCKSTRYHLVLQREKNSALIIWMKNVQLYNLISVFYCFYFKKGRWRKGREDVCYIVRIIVGRFFCGITAFNQAFLFLITKRGRSGCCLHYPRFNFSFHIMQ